MAPELLIAVAAGFAVVTGVNDGGALIAPGLRVPALSVAASLTSLTTAVIAFPLLVSNAVADTMVNAIVPADPDGVTALSLGFVVAVAVVVCLTRVSLPTSLTLAIIGGIAGAGLGIGLSVGWGTVVRVLAIGLAAPVAGILLALGGSWGWLIRNTGHLSTVRRAHVAAFVAQSVAYGANDGQKMLVLFLAAGITAGNDPTTPWWAYPVIAIGFAAGALLGLPKIARGVGNGILNTRSTHAVTAEFSAAVAVLGSAAIGTPVSMTQAIAGGLLGAGVHDSYRRIRWRVVRNLALAWALTLPASFGLAALTGLLVKTFQT